MVLLFFEYLSIVKKCFSFNIKYSCRYQNFKIIKGFAKVELFCISKSIKDRTVFLFAIDKKQKNWWAYHKPIIDLGQFE